MNKLIVTALIIGLTLSACGSSQDPKKDPIISRTAIPTFTSTLVPTGLPSEFPSEVTWETALEILYSGEVDLIYQTHSLEVTLILKDGQSVHTIEPTMDAIFGAVDRCGEPCSGIGVGTE